jgi:Domain of unknown function (DUF4157)
MKSDASESVSQIVNNVLASPGEALNPPTRGFMEQRFGHDFSEVRIHTGGPARESAEAISARAYTVGSNVVFGREHYAPDTSDGKLVLAHELAHVVQQSRGGAAPPLDPTSSLERAADAAATIAIARSGPVSVEGASGIGLARLTWKDVAKRVRPVAGLLGGSLGEKVVVGAAVRAETITGPDVPKPAEHLVNQGAEALSKLAPKPRQAPTSAPPAVATGPVGEAGIKQGLMGASQPVRGAPQLVDPDEDTPELKELFKERWRKAQVFHGIKLMYVAQRTLTRAATSDHVFKKSSRYWIISRADRETGHVFYYVAHNRQVGRDEWAIGPAELDAFLENEQFLANSAERIYPSGGGELKGWQVKSGQSQDLAMEGQWGDAISAVFEANWEAAHDPELVLSTAAGLAPTRSVPKMLPRVMRFLRPRAAGALSQAIVAAENSLPVHTGAGGRMVNQPGMVAGGLHPASIASEVQASNVAKLSSAAAAERVAAEEVAKPSAASGIGKPPTTMVNPAVLAPAIGSPSAAQSHGDTPTDSAQAPAKDENAHSAPAPTQSVQDFKRITEAELHAMVDKAFNNPLDPSWTIDPSGTDDKTIQSKSDRTRHVDIAGPKDASGKPVNPGQILTPGQARAAGRVLGKTISANPSLVAAWDQAKAEVLKRYGPLTQSNYADLYNRTRDLFWDYAKADTDGARRFFEAGDFVFTDARAPLFGAAMNQGIGRIQFRLSLDHLAPKATGANWQYALDADKLMFVMQSDNTKLQHIESTKPSLKRE